MAGGLKQQNDMLQQLNDSFAYCAKQAEEMEQTLSGMDYIIYRFLHRFTVEKGLRKFEIRISS